ncbi:hypothetical protein THRCLA_04984 [Thraustotheca clavata]|uniref:Uncharacterized protein n=1 Tax=Thraustotheca clavata TaxID=74557 RepID=A0A1V9ZXC1_9STRA|nr:hypothetical protein THRCLA_04984 [Thraustotheca clavata]
MNKRREEAIVPISKRLKQSADDVIAKLKNEDDIEAQIKDLEAELESSSEEESSSSEEEAKSSSDEESREFKVVNLSEYRSESVPALPKELLPKGSCQSNKVAPHKPIKKPLNKEKVEIVGRVPFACKPCGFVGANLEEFLAHKNSPGHDKEKFRCKLCVKEFTSAEQLEEHKQGKWHQMRHRTKKSHFQAQAPKICYDYARGKCSYGDKCSFEHSGGSNASDSKKKTRPCTQFQAGNCRFGNRCIFAHATNNA